MNNASPWNEVFAPIRRPIVNPEDAEVFGAELLAILGFTQVDVTRRGADAGIDVTSDEAVAQVKFQSSTVGRPALQRLVGACGGKGTVFLSLGGFSRHAVEYANTQSMALFCFSPLGDVAAVNSTAVQLVNALGSAVAPASDNMLKVNEMVNWAGTAAQLVSAEALRITSYSKLNRKEQRMMRRLDPVNNQLRTQLEDVDRLARTRTRRKGQEDRRQLAMFRTSQKIKKNLLICAKILDIPLPPPPW